VTAEPDINQYLTTITGHRPALNRLSAVSRGMPLFIHNLYNLWDTELFEKHVILAVAATEDNYTPNELAKHCDLLQSALAAPVALVLPHVTSYNRNRLVRLQVPFIVPGRQLFLPSLLVDLRETGMSLRPTREALSASAQAVVLYRLLRGDVRELTLGELAHRLGYSAMALTLAADELAKLKLVEVRSEGRKRHIEFVAAGAELWRLAEPHLKSPVKRSLWVAAKSVSDLLIYKAGVTALEELSALAGDALPVYAGASKQIRALLRDGVIQELPNYDEATMRLETWRYEPGLFAESGRADPVSLNLSLRDGADERVRLALREMMEGVAWQA